ncbi:sensor histidine kinase, partial [Campylobacter jejuni]|nr:sensor histidine kinase [Campylobacter jejuni]
KKFYKIDAKSDNSFGLGLFLVKKILNIHKSYLEISSTLGYGSSFSFKLSQG